MNSSIEEGFCIVCGTEQGLFARVRRHPTAIILRSTDERGVSTTAELPLDTRELRLLACAGGFFSYAAGVAYQLLIHNEVQGIEIDNYRTTLPLKKGLSSSAAFCVLVARAWNRAYDLKYSVRGEMELAYKVRAACSNNTAAIWPPFSRIGWANWLHFARARQRRRQSAAAWTNVAPLGLFPSS